MTDCAFANIQAEIKKLSKYLLRIKLGAAAQDLIYLLNIHYCSFFVDSSHPTAGVSCGWVGAWIHRRSGKSSKPDKSSKNAPRTHPQLHAVLGS